MTIVENENFGRSHKLNRDNVTPFPHEQLTGALLRELRVEHGLSLRSAVAAGGSGLSQQGLARIESDQRSPSLGSLMTIAAAYGIVFITDADGTSIVKP